MFKRRCRAWLLTVYGFETSVMNLNVFAILTVSCMTSYRLRFWNHERAFCWWDVREVYGRAWLLTVYGFQENKKHLSISGSAFLIRGEDDKKNTATLSRNGWKNFFVIVQVFIPPQKQTNEPNSDESPNSGMNPIIVTSQKVQRSDASTIEPASTKPITNHGIYIHLFSSSTLIPY